MTSFEGKKRQEGGKQQVPGCNTAGRLDKGSAGGGGGEGVGGGGGGGRKGEGGGGGGAWDQALHVRQLSSGKMRAYLACMQSWMLVVHTPVAKSNSSKVRKCIGTKKSSQQ